MSDQSAQSSESVADLIALGRDREAVDAARRTPPAPGAVVDGVAQVDEILPSLDSMLEHLEPHHLALPTPCDQLDVAGVLDHMIGGAMLFAPAFRGDAAPDARPRRGYTALDWWGRSIAELYIAMHLPGAQDRVLDTPFGALPGRVFAQYLAFDGLVHAWDIATATGLEFEPTPEVVAAVDTFIRGFLTPEMRDGNAFTDEKQAPSDATPIEKLAAFTGRTVPTKETLT